jgi:hypothetical protein
MAEYEFYEGGGVEADSLSYWVLTRDQWIGEAYYPNKKGGNKRTIHKL